MKKTQSENKILFAVGVVTILILGLVIYKNLNQQKVQSTFQTQTEQKKEVPEPTKKITTEVEPFVGEELFLEVGSPTNGITVSKPNLQVSGRTNADAEVFINEVELRADGQGNFSTNLTLEEGENVIVVTAVDEEGNFAEQELTVTYEAE